MNDNPIVPIRLVPGRTVPERFANTTGRVRWKQSKNGIVLEQEYYANFDESHQALQYPECGWFHVPCV